MVIDPTKDEVTHLIIEKGFLLKEDKVLPVSFVVDARDDQVTLYDVDTSLDRLPTYREEEYVAVQDEDLAQPFVGGAQIMYNYPPLGSTGKSRPGMRLKKEEVKNIPEDVEPVKEGSKVFSIDNEHVGNVEEVIIDPDTDDATHLVLSKGLFLVEEKLIPVGWIDAFDEGEIQLAVDKNVIQRLPKYRRQEKISFG